MSELKFNAENLTEMKNFYQEELAKTLNRLNHINDVLSQLGAEGTQVEMTFSGAKSTGRKSKPSTPKRKYNKKRGPKSKWDKVIIKTITKADRPLTYDDITDFLMISEGREAAQRKNMKATVQNTVFRLRKDKKIKTFSMGSRTKYIAPKNWFDTNGDISQEYKVKVKLPVVAEKLASKGEKKKPGRPRKTQVTAPKAKTTKSSSTKTKPAPKPKAVKKTAPKTKSVKKVAPKAKAKAKQAPKAKSVAAAAIPTPKAVSKAAPTAKSTAPKKKAANPPKKKAKAKPAKKAAPKKASAANASPAKKATPKKKKSTTPSKKPAAKTTATKSPAAAKAKPSKSKAKKTVAPGPRKLAMTKTVKVKKKKK